MPQVAGTAAFGDTHTKVIIDGCDDGPMSDADSPMGFKARHPSDRSMAEGTRLLFILLGIVLGGAGVFVGFTLGLA